MTNQSEPLDLDEVEARAGGLYEYATGFDTAWQEEADQLAGTDVPALVAEVRRLRAERAELIQQRDRIAMDTLKAVTEPAGAPVAAEQPAGVPESHPDHERPSEAFLRAETVAARVQAIRDLADKADPPRPEISFFGDHGHVVGEWMRRQAEYEERRHAAEEAPDIAAAAAAAAVVPAVPTTTKDGAQ